MPEWRRRYPGVETLSLAVMGCIVNGPGESKQADIGISLPGTGEAPAAPVFIDGKKAMTLCAARTLPLNSDRSWRTISSGDSAGGGARATVRHRRKRGIRPEARVAAFGERQ